MMKTHRSIKAVTAGEAEPRRRRANGAAPSRRVMRALAGAVGLTLGVGLVGPASAATAGSQSFTILYAPGRAPTAYAGGVYSGTGTVSSKASNQVFFPAGSVTIEVAVAEPTGTVEPHTCVTRLQGKETFRVVGGTGLFAGAVGSGTWVAVLTAEFLRLPDGSCSTDQGSFYGVEIWAGTLQLAGNNP
jgi:hypothetical protein